MPITSPRLTARSAFRRPALQWAMEGDWRGLIEWVRDTTTILNGALQGKLNATETVVHLVPTSNNASSDFGAGTLYMTYPNVNDGVAIINHANNSNDDKTFAYTLIG